MSTSVYNSLGVPCTHFINPEKVKRLNQPSGLEPVTGGLVTEHITTRLLLVKIPFITFAFLYYKPKLLKNFKNFTTPAMNKVQVPQGIPHYKGRVSTTASTEVPGNDERLRKT